LGAAGAAARKPPPRARAGVGAFSRLGGVRTGAGARGLVAAAARGGVPSSSSPLRFTSSPRLRFASASCAACCAGGAFVDVAGELRS